MMLRRGVVGVLVRPIFSQMVKVGLAKDTFLSLKRENTICNYRHLVLPCWSLTNPGLTTHISKYHTERKHCVEFVTCNMISKDSCGNFVELHGKISSLNKRQCILRDNTGSVRLILSGGDKSKLMEITNSSSFVRIIGVVQKNKRLRGNIKSSRYNYVVYVKNIISASSVPSSFNSQPKEKLNLELLPEELSRCSPGSMHYFFQRSCNCATLKKEKTGKDVALCGWVHTKHDDNSFTLQDGHGSVIVNYTGEVKSLIPGSKGIDVDDLVFVKGVISSECEQPNDVEKEYMPQISAKELKVIEESSSDAGSYSLGHSTFQAPESRKNNSDRVITTDKNEKKNTSPDVNRYTLRSHNCGEINESLIGKTVYLMGWALYIRLCKFIVLADKYGSIQLFVPDSRNDLKELLHDILPESVISVRGTVSSRPRGLENKFMKSGQFEVCVEDLKVISKSSHLPIQSKSKNPSKNVQLKYRYLDLRHNVVLKKTLAMRSDLMHKMRKFLVEDVGFLEVETPTLFRRTPGGAQEFIVPTRNKGEFYSLVQSPQQFKQLLMVGGIDRYFQIARCYRDEGGEKDRQPEFTQLDLEMSFCNREGVLNLIEDLIQYIWPHDIQRLVTPFPRLTYEEAMSTYGTDKPDTRFNCKIIDVTDGLRTSGRKDESNTTISPFLKLEDFTANVMVIPQGTAFFKSLEGAMKETENYSLFMVKVKDIIFISHWLSNKFSPKLAQSVVQKILPNPGDVVVIAIGSKSCVLKALGDLRMAAANVFHGDDNDEIKKDGFHFTWILDFPLFELVDGQMKSVHHPFTQPHPDDVHLLSKDPLKARSLHYDLVLNGSEIGGGSIRIHNGEFQKHVLKNILRLDDVPLKHLIDALSSGAPSHGGFALGIDRFVASLCRLAYINDVIAFPKASSGRDIMSGAPCGISDEEKALYHIN